MTGILGKKLGMTQVFTDDGQMVAVTAIEAGPCPVLMVNDKSIQLGFDGIKEKNVRKPQAGFFKKINVKACRLIREVGKESGKEYKVGEELKVDIFNPGEKVDVTGISIGKGFQGGMKRWHWDGGPQTHGSTSHRRIGSIGSSTTPGRVFKGHHLPGHMGAVRKTIQNLKVIKTDLENNLILVKGAVPGYKNSYVIINKAKKVRIPKAQTAISSATKKPAKK
ncbi:MAG: 50S ribosomal protein L3 [Candidatus Omnitrophica bacterium]|nr:50S ribosomal protein L3 [Candidatus Omnitrophota bacterium]